MKVLKFTLLLISVVLISCDKDDNGNTPTNRNNIDDNSIIKAKINEINYSYSEGYAYGTSGLTIRGEDSLMRYKFFTIVINEPLVKGNKDLINHIDSSYAYFYGTQDTNYYSNEGTINIIELDTINKKISGTFDFKAAEMIVTTPTGDTAFVKGTFNTKYHN